MARSLFFIRHIPSGQWYVSSRGFYFSPHFDTASIFHQLENAEKQIRGLRGLKRTDADYYIHLEKPEKDVDGGWWTKVHITPDMKDDFEVVEFELVQKV